MWVELLDHCVLFSELEGEIGGLAVWEELGLDNLIV